jgi:hypothetical protein
MLAPQNHETVLVHPREARHHVDAAPPPLGIAGDGSSTTATTLEMAEALSAFQFSDELWARLIYDLVICARSEDPPIENLVAALVPIYFGRVGSFVIENRHQTTDQAEDRDERQARAFEQLKPYLVDRWEAAVVSDAATGSAATPARQAVAASNGTESTATAAAGPAGRDAAEPGR